MHCINVEQFRKDKNNFSNEKLDTRKYSHKLKKIYSACQKISTLNIFRHFTRNVSGYNNFFMVTTF